MGAPASFIPDAPSSAAPASFQPDAAAPLNQAYVNGQPVNVPDDPNSFLGHALPYINPVNLVKGAWNAVSNLPATMRNIGAQEGQMFDRARAAYDAGDYAEAARHGFDFLLPPIGALAGGLAAGPVGAVSGAGLGLMAAPTAEAMTDEAQAGKYRAAAGDAAGLLGSLYLPTKVGDALEALPTPPASAAAGERMANEQMADVMAPKVYANKIRFNNQAAKIGAAVARGTTAITKNGLLGQVLDNAETATDALDAAYGAIPRTQKIATAPIVQALQQRIKTLSVTGIGGTVEPANFGAQIGALRQAIDEVKGLGSLTDVQQLRTLKQAWDQGAKAQFMPATAPDALKLQGAGSGWADARTALNEYVVGQYPQLAPLNANASLWINASKVMKAAQEAERARPKVGRAIMARAMGALLGSAEGGPLGAAAGAVAAPAIEQGLSGLSPSLKIIAARRLALAADAIRSGRYRAAQTILRGVEDAVKRGAAPTLEGGAVVRAAQGVGLPVAPVLAPAAQKSGASSQP